MLIEVLKRVAQQTMLQIHVLLISSWVNHKQYSYFTYMYCITTEKAQLQRNIASIYISTFNVSSSQFHVELRLLFQIPVSTSLQKGLNYIVSVRHILHSTNIGM